MPNITEKYHRIHWLNFLIFLKQFFPLLILPVLRGVISAVYSDFNSWLNGASFDIFVVICLLSLSILHYLSFGYTIQNAHFIVKQGVLKKEYLSIPFSKVSSVTFSYPLFARPFRGVKLLVNPSVRFNPLGRKKSAICLFIAKKSAEQLLDSPLCKQNSPSSSCKTYLQKPFFVALLSLFSSRSFGGLIVFITLLNEGSKVLGNALKDKVLLDLQHLSSKLPLIISPLVTFMILLVLVGFFIGFLKNFLENKNFYMERSENTLKITSGFLTKQTHILSVSDIYYLEIHQNLLMQLFSICSATISVAGYGKRTKTVPIFIPATKKETLLSIVSNILPEFAPHKISIRPAPPYLIKFFWQPFTFFFFALLSLPWIPLFFPSLSSFTLATFLFLLFFCGLSLFFALVDMKKSGIGIDKNAINLSYAKTLSLHHIVIPKPHISQIKFVQHPKTKHLSDITFFSFSDGRKKHKIKNIPLTPDSFFKKSESA